MNIDEYYIVVLQILKVLLRHIMDLRLNYFRIFFHEEFKNG